MRSLVVSDLHLGAPAGHDVLRRPEVRPALLSEVERADQVVLLGDVLELRGTPAPDAIERARPALTEIGEAAGDARVVLVPGNHDHQLAAEWLERRRHRRGPPSVLDHEQVWRPGRSDLANRVVRALGARDVSFAYPGLWVRPDVYATHGHYLDCHNAVPALEALAAAALARVMGGVPARAATPDAYERVLAPLYAFSYQAAQGMVSSLRTPRPGISVRIWQRLNPHDGRLSLARVLLGGMLIPAAVAGVNRAGLGPFSPDLSPTALRRAALRAMAEARRRLGIEAAHLIFGHTHRAGPLPDDDLADGWELAGGERIWNSGSWVYEPPLIGPRGTASGHWPGACVTVEDDGPPRLERLPVAVEPVAA